MSCPTICTPLGKAKGFALPKAKCDEAKQVFAFMGLPFAKPPVGELRFEQPQKPQPWDGVLDACKSPAAPMQSLYFLDMQFAYQPTHLVCDEDFKHISEDCLYLNVYTSKPDKAMKMPVLVWLYGGGFTVGSAIGYNGQAICELNDVVLVVPHFRLNVFGFFSLGKDTKWPGNVGLLDQVMALEWIRDNISGFGGDTNNVTIFGESSGSVSVSMHVASPMSRGLFHRAISHSAVGTMPYLINEDLSAALKTILKGLNITATEPEEIMKQIKAVDASKFIDVLEKDPSSISLVATVDGKFIPKHPKQLLKDGNFNPVPYIIGFNNTEGAGVLSFRYPEGFSKGLDEQTGRKAAKGLLAAEIPADKLDVVSTAVIDFYSAEFGDDKYKWSKLLAAIVEESWFTVSSIQQALVHSDAGHETYLYYMTQQLRMHHDDAFSEEVQHKADFCDADHGDDVMMTS